MKKLTLSMTSMACACCFSTGVLAQRDSSWLDAGTLKLKKAFTQTISIKGEDLEKMPFADLGEAIDSWLYGAYSSVYSLVYVVDGVPLTDISGYSIYDIEEVTLIQHAAVQVNAGAGQTQVVLIRTRKKGKGPLGITAAVQTGLVNRDFGQFFKGGGIRSTTSSYDQVYAGLNKNEKNIDFGLSANYQRDVMPRPRADSITGGSPFHLDRVRLNGYLDVRLGEGNELSLHVNYTRQGMDSAQQYWLSLNDPFLPPNSNMQISQSTHQRQTSFSPSIRWKSDFGKRWHNELEVVYLSVKEHAEDLQDLTDTFNTAPATPKSSIVDSGFQQTRHIYARERLFATITGGGWSVTPAISVYYEHIQDSVHQSEYSDNSGYLSQGSYYLTGKGKNWFLSPSLDISYRSLFDLQVGLLSQLTKRFVLQPDKDFPYASFTTDLFKWWNRTNPASLKLYGSYSGTIGQTTNDYSLPNLSFHNNNISIESIIPYGAYYGPNVPYTTNGGPGFVGPVSYARTWAWAIGAGFSTVGGRLQAGYYYERNKFLSPEEGYGALFFGGGPVYNYIYWIPTVSESHHLNISAVFLKGGEKGLGWRSGLNLTNTHFYVQTPYSFLEAYSLKGDQGGISPSWTGGWTNQLRYSNISMGLVLLYHLNEDTNRYVFYELHPQPKINSIVLQNIFLAYRLPVSGKKEIELYLDGRNLFRSKNSDITDGRRFYTIGGKIAW